MLVVITAFSVYGVKICSVVWWTLIVVFVLNPSCCCFLKCLAARCQLINPLTCNSVTYSNKGNFGFYATPSVWFCCYHMYADVNVTDLLSHVPVWNLWDENRSCIMTPPTIRNSDCTSVVLRLLFLFLLFFVISIFCSLFALCLLFVSVCVSMCAV